MNHRRLPTEFFNGLHRSTGKEYKPLVVFLRSKTYFYILLGMTLKEIIIVDEINLHARRLQSSHFQNQRMVVVVDGDIGAGHPYYLMELIPPLVDAPVFGHESTSFKAEFLDFGRNEATYIADC